MILILEIALGVTLGLALFHSLLTYGRDLLVLLKVLLYLVAAILILVVPLLGAFYAMLHPDLTASYIRQVAPYFGGICWSIGLFFVVSVGWAIISDRKNLKNRAGEDKS
jgi:hypothetical protein